MRCFDYSLVAFIGQYTTCVLPDEGYQNSIPQLQLELVFTGPVSLLEFSLGSWNTSANSYHQTRTYWAL